MRPEISSIAAKLKQLEDELEAAIAHRREELRFTVHERKVRFEREIRLRHREMKTRLLHYVLGGRPKIVVTAPVIYSVLIPLRLLDLLASAYQAICFPVYGIPRVHRRDYSLSIAATWPTGTRSKSCTASSTAPTRTE